MNSGRGRGKSRTGPGHNQHRNMIMEMLWGSVAVLASVSSRPNNGSSEMVRLCLVRRYRVDPRTLGPQDIKKPSPALVLRIMCTI